MPYLVKIARRGWLTRGRAVKSAEHATIYSSPSAAQRAIERAENAGIAGPFTVVKHRRKSNDHRF